MKCPICNRPVQLSDPEAPFCSDRCREVDLGNWATEKYVISTPAYHLRSESPQPENGQAENGLAEHEAGE